MKRMILLFMLVATAVLAVACGGGAAEEPAPTFSFDVTAQDTFVYEPAALTVKAGSQVTVNFTNSGVLQHNWLLISPGVSAADASDADALAGATTGEIGSGETKSVTFTAPPAGTYQYVCTVAGHAEAGMLGTLTVEP